MANNTLTSEQRTKWRALYRCGWRAKKWPGSAYWFVADDQDRQRSHLYLNRDHAVAEVVS